MCRPRNSSPIAHTQVGVDMSTNREAQLGADARVWSRLGVSSAGEEESEGAPSLRPATRPLPFQTMVDYSGFDTRTGRPSTMVCANL